jgi:hypothetical protein
MGTQNPMQNTGGGLLGNTGFTGGTQMNQMGGQMNTGGGGLFGTSSTMNTMGTSNTGMGMNTMSSGTTGGGIFGGMGKSTTGFGGNTTSGFGGGMFGGGMGNTGMSNMGATTTFTNQTGMNTGSFGGTNTMNQGMFGGSTNTGTNPTGGIFGQQQKTTTTTGFMGGVQNTTGGSFFGGGSNTMNQGLGNTGMMGSNTMGSNMMGGNMMQQQGFMQQQQAITGTFNIPYQLTIVPETGQGNRTDNIKIMCITGMNQYSAFSIEELRWLDVKAKKQGLVPQKNVMNVGNMLQPSNISFSGQTTMGTGFGNQQTNTGMMTGGGFQSTTTQGGGLFQNQQGLGFNQNKLTTPIKSNTNTGLFNQQPQTSQFTTQQQTGGFSQGGGMFNQQQTGTGMMGSLTGQGGNLQTGGSLFNKQPTQGGIQTGGLFSNTGTGVTTVGGGMFNNTQTTTTGGLFSGTTNQNQMQPNTGGMGLGTQTGMTTGGLFSNTQTGGGLFQNTNQQQTGTTSSTVFQSTGGGITTTGGGLFSGGGSTTGTGGGLFSSQTQTGTGGGLFSGTTTTQQNTGNTGLFTGTSQTTAGGGLFSGNTQQGGSSMFQGTTNQPTTNTGGLFSSTTQPTSGGLFAGNATTKQATGGGLFANTTTNQPSGGLFASNTANTGGGLFANTATTSQPSGLFNSAQPIGGAPNVNLTAQPMFYPIIPVGNILGAFIPDLSKIYTPKKSLDEILKELQHNAQESESLLEPKKETKSEFTLGKNIYSYQPSYLDYSASLLNSKRKLHKPTTSIYDKLTESTHKHDKQQQLIPKKDYEKISTIYSPIKRIDHEDLHLKKSHSCDATDRKEKQVVSNLRVDFDSKFLLDDAEEKIIKERREKLPNVELHISLQEPVKLAFNITIDKTLKVSELKSQILDKLRERNSKIFKKISTNGFALMRKFTLIKENITIKDSDIRDGDTLYIVIKEGYHNDRHDDKEKQSDKKKKQKRTESENSEFTQLAPLDRLPILTKPGYKTIPDMRNIYRMTLEELQNVDNFSIFNEYGRIDFKGKTDLTNLNIDQIVNIEEKKITVYQNGDLSYTPDVGKGLNKPAVLRLYNCFPEGKKELTDEQRSLYTASLQKICKEKGVRSYIKFRLNI